MCGITGFWTSSQDTRREMDAVVAQMTERLAHRGPDDTGIWVDRQAGLALGHRRLSILDLSPDGRQPMISPTGRYAIVFNGEVYNFQELARDLAVHGHRFRSHSDTEVMLAAFEAWGIEDAIKRFNGMFAFALWDRNARELHLVRDRMGEKPLYYGWAGQSFLFGSELKALLAHPEFETQVDRNSLGPYLKYNCIPAPYTIYRGIRKLPPGTRLHLTLCRPEALGEPQPYWSPIETARRGHSDPYVGSAGGAIQTLDTLLRDAVKLRMISDVPLGAFLSGGIDSSLIVALMQQQTAAPVRTFSIGFMEEGYDESENAATVADRLGTQHTAFFVSPREARDVIPILPSIYDEPFSDSSQIPTYIVSKLARRDVTVSLSGDGGDELFGGYRRYFIWSRIWNRLAWIPNSARQAGARALRFLTATQWNYAAALFHRLPLHFRAIEFPGDKIYRLARILAAEDSLSRYDVIVSACESPRLLVRSCGGRQRFSDREVESLGRLDFCHLMMALDVAGYLPDDILVKLDRASMAAGLESRAPFLDHRVAEFAARLPLDLQIRAGTGKWILRRLLARYVPPSLTEGPKKGFSVPIAKWLRGDLRPWAEELLRGDRLKSEGFFDPAAVRALWDDLLCAKRDVEHQVWSVLMFQAWLEGKTEPVAATRTALDRVRVAGAFVN